MSVSLETKENIRPICQSCNNSMGTKNMNDYMKEHSFVLRNKEKIQEEHYYIKTEELKKKIDDIEIENRVLKRNNEDYFKKIVDKEKEIDVLKVSQTKPTERDPKETNTENFEHIVGKTNKDELKLKEKEIEISKLNLEIITIKESLIKKDVECNTYLNELTNIRYSLNKNMEVHSKEKKELQCTIENLKQSNIMKQNRIEYLTNTINDMKNEIKEMEEESDSTSDSDTYVKSSSSNSTKLKKSEKCFCGRQNEKSRRISSSKYCGYHYGGSY